jgi:glycosyltransferase involved in cell wall biosynthesis
MNPQAIMTTMLSIVHVYKDYWPVVGGIENHVRDLAEAEAARGHGVTVLVTNPGGQPAREMINGVQVIRAGRLATVASTPLSLALPLLLARLKPEITNVHFPYPVGELSQWLLGRRWPYILSYHSDVVKQQRILRFYNPLLRRVLAGAAGILAGSDNYVQSSPYLRPLAHKCTIVPYAVGCGAVCSGLSRWLRGTAVSRCSSWGGTATTKAAMICCAPWPKLPAELAGAPAVWRGWATARRVAAVEPQPGIGR